jgi:hypothetical protein
MQQAMGTRDAEAGHRGMTPFVAKALALLEERKQEASGANG